MAQRSVTDYFTSRKRPATDDFNPVSKKVLKCEIIASKKPEITSTELLKNDDLESVKNRLLKSEKLEKLKNSIRKFKNLEKKLDQVEKKQQLPKLQVFSKIEFDVPVSPQKASPKKIPVSPLKRASLGRNLFGNTIANSSSVISEVEVISLQLPYRYRLLGEIFRAVDTITQILFNRKETIYFNKLKPAVEEMTKRTFHLKHLAQIRHLFPDAFTFSQEKVRSNGLEQLRNMQWDLAIVPKIEGDVMNTEIVLKRRTIFNDILFNKVKVLHHAFLKSLIPPLDVSLNSIKRWHPDFDLENVPDIDLADLPQPPQAEKFTTGRDFLENTSKLFDVNGRMKEALEKLKKNETVKSDTSIARPDFKGIPQSLLEKVRERQTVKALKSMTRNANTEKEIQMYARLPELARFVWNLFITEKKTVLDLEVVVEKLSNSYGVLNKSDCIDHLKLISKETINWLVFINLRMSTFIKLAKQKDLSQVIAGLQKIAGEKSRSSTK